ncbi:MAG: hypothetical protein IPH88_11735 [Bacteroidales bacterium]|nr:hypothetical protein [Bacteroidales bacterium]
MLRWTISNGTCAASTDDITVTFYQAPTTATVGADQSLCGTLESAGLGGNTPVVGTGAWSIVSGGTGAFSSTAAANATFTADDYGVYVLRWTISNGVCTASTADVTVTFFESPVVSNAGAAQNLCNVTNTTLAGNDPTPGTGLWTLVSGPNTPAITTPTAYNSTVTSMVPGVYVFKWTISNGVCTPSESTVTITNYATPTTAVAGADQNLCGTLVSAVWVQTHQPTEQVHGLSYPVVPVLSLRLLLQMQPSLLMHTVYTFFAGRFQTAHVPFLPIT